jgi:hypothetical protein
MVAALAERLGGSVGEQALTDEHFGSVARVCA